MAANSSERRTKPLTTLLIVDDNYFVRVLLRDWVEEQFPGCRLLEAGTGEEAVELALDERPTVILMDVGLPHLNGIEATRRIMAKLPETRVVLMSPYDASRYVEEGLDAGAKAILQKHTMDTELGPLLRMLLTPGDPPTQPSG